MSFTEPSVTDGVQPDAGQGDGGQQSGGQPYADYLARVPDEVRGDIEPIFRDWNSHVNSRFQEHAEYRNQWKPYEEAGVTQYAPQDIQAAFSLLQNPEQLRAWADQQYGPVTPEPATPEPDPYSFQDPSQQEWLTKQLEPFQRELQELRDWRTQQEQQAQEAQIDQQLNAEITALKEKHAANLPEDVRNNFEDIIQRFGWKYAEPGANPREVVAKAWADFESLSNQLRSSAIQEKIDQPAPAERGGGADVAPEPLGKGDDALRNARRIAIEQLRQNRAA